MHHSLRGEIGRIGDDLTRFTRDLITIPSPTRHEKDVARRIDAEMRWLGYDLVFTDDVGNVIGVFVGDHPGCALLVTTHMDTGRPDRIEEWLRPPFGGEVVDGRIHGAGAVRCKGGLASLVFGSRTAARAQPGRGPMLVVAATVGGADGLGAGLRHLLRATLPEIRSQPLFAVVGEPTALTVMLSGGGRIEIDVVAAGDDEDAVRGAALRAGDELRRGDREWRLLEGTGGGADPGALERCGGGFVRRLSFGGGLGISEPEDELLRRVEDDLGNALGPRSRVAVTAKVGGRDHRFYTGHRQSFQAIARPWATDPEHPLVVSAREAMTRAGCRWKVRGSGCREAPVSTSGSVAAGEFGLPVLGYGPGRWDPETACNESVSQLALESATFGLAVLIRGLLDNFLLNPRASGSGRARSPERRVAGPAP